MSNVTTVEVVKRISKAGISLLEGIYNHRCLTVELIKRKIKIVNKEDITEERLMDIVLFLKEEGYLTDKEFLCKKTSDINTAYFITNSGIKLIKEVKSIPSVILSNKNKVKAGYYTAAQLDISERLINHQMYLNEFAIEIEEILRGKNVNWEYYDEKYVSNFSVIRPDGMYKIFDTYFFLETDMGTESKKQLADKWDNYRLFTNSNEYKYKDGDIKVLFACENVKNVKNRVKLVKKAYSDKLADVLDTSMEIHIGDRATLLKQINDFLIDEILATSKEKLKTKEILRDLHGFDVYKGSALKKRNIINMEFDFYVNKKNKKTKELLVLDGRLQEYFIDLEHLNPSSSISKIEMYHIFSTLFNETFKRNYSYVLVVDSFEDIYESLEAVGVNPDNNIYFTTIERLESMSFGKAMVKIDLNGCVYEYVDEGLNDSKFLYKINEKKSL